MDERIPTEARDLNGIEPLETTVDRPAAMISQHSNNDDEWVKNQPTNNEEARGKKSEEDDEIAVTSFLVRLGYSNS